jgi:hypothetical protein
MEYYTMQSWGMGEKKPSQLYYRNHPPVFPLKLDGKIFYIFHYPI